MSTGRFGVGLLPIKRHSESLPGELMASNDVGLVAVKNPTTNSIVSFDYITRFNKSYEDFRNKMIARGTIGKIGKIDVSNEPVCPLVNNTPLATPELIINTGKKMSFVAFDIDIEVIDIYSGIPMKIDPLVSFAFTVATNKDTSTTRSYQISEKLSVVNNTTTIPAYTGFETISESIDNDFKFDYIKVKLPDGILPENTIIALNSILVSFKEVV